MPTRAALRRALLDADDLPDGWRVESASADPTELTVTGQGSACRELAALLRAQRVDGSRAGADRSFVGPAEDGGGAPSLDQTLDALDSDRDADRVVADVSAAVEGCGELTLTLGSSASSPVSVTRRSDDRLGSGGVMLRFRATEGALAGFDVSQVVTAVDSVVLTLVSSGVGQSRLDEIAGTAVETLEDDLS